MRGAGKAAELIDLHKHQGVHPRVGAADVIPFVPLDGSTLDDCVAIAHRAGEEIWRRFRVPVYFYEAAARIPERKRLGKRPAHGLRRPAARYRRHRRASHSGRRDGGRARHFLIAYNVNLATRDAAIAQAIAKKIRESSGGFRFVKAMGLYLASRDCAQVSMNLTNFAEIPLDRLYDSDSSTRPRASGRPSPKRADRIHPARAPSTIAPRSSAARADFD